ncbi:MAG: ABC transporter permease [Tatlockia sp.]|jgi:lipopolysaccharide transport system permease protein
MQAMLRSLWQYRHFLLSSIHNELRLRFVRNKLGALWMIINPLTQVLLYTLVLSHILAAKLPGVEFQYAYAIYLMSGLLAWNLFSDIISGCSRLFIDQGNLMKKMNFPRVTLPCILVGTAVVNNALLLLAMLVVFLTLGHWPGFAIFWLVPVMALVVILSLGIGLILGILNVFVRDIGQLIPLGLQIMFWFTPIIYPETIIPENYRPLLKLNPLYTLTQGYQDVLVYGKMPNFEQMGSIVILAIGMLFMSLVMFRKASKEMVDVL